MLAMELADDGVLIIRVSEKLTKEDYDGFTAEFDRLAAEARPVRILIEMDNFRGWDIAGLWEDIKFDVSHYNDIGRVAIVGDKTWEEWGTTLSKPFTKAEMRYFDKSDKTEARNWLRQPQVTGV